MFVGHTAVALAAKARVPGSSLALLVATAGALAWISLGLWLFVTEAWWVDRHRVAVLSGEPSRAIPRPE
jgi:hypothetical protein